MSSKSVTIKRRGSRANYGTRAIYLIRPRVRWHPESKGLVISAEEVSDFSEYSCANHDYDVELPLALVPEMLRALSEACQVNPQAAREVLGGTLPDQLRIATVCAQPDETATGAA